MAQPKPKPKEEQFEEEERILITEEGKKALEEELRRLLERERKEVLEHIRESRKVGEFMEDTDYDDAKKEQAFIQGRIEELQQILRIVKVVPKNKIPTNKVGFGSVVDLTNLSTGRQVTYRIVGPFEANPLEGKISYQSPLGEALMDKRVGDVVEVRAPAGIIRYRVEKISK
ncbi:MAG: transcription elongation factor GreA [Armatimonadetes bacterium]|nr:transcription elongation factor GreA [Armatimonadota bacterium]MDW8026765.1 transcription elongation factor GreA [Armatimonadota bacterium]